MKILVTGSSGHLGEALCATLQQSGINYIGIDIKQSVYTNHVGSITDVDFLNTVMENVDFIIHTATLHKPHVATHSKANFVATNISGTLNLLEQARIKHIKGFIFTSTTSTFGEMLTPKETEPAVWVTEKLSYIPKNIYGVTKIAAEDLCYLYHRNHNLPCIILKTSRFFQEKDDNKRMRELFVDLNIKANEYLHRRVDVEDVVAAHLLAIEKIETIGFGKYIISATTPFEEVDLPALNTDSVSVVKKYFPEMEQIYQALNWKMFSKIGRVYVNKKARIELEWQPKYDYHYVLNCLKEKRDFRSQLALSVGIKGYHKDKFKDGLYPVLEG